MTAHGHRFAAIPRRRSESLERGLFLGGYGYSNWYHWAIELLPKLSYWQKLTPRLRSYPFLVGEDLHAYPAFLDALALFCEDPEVVVLNNDTLYTVGHLLHINAPSLLPVNLRGTNEMRITDFLIRPASIQDWRERVGVEGRKHTGNRRLFLARLDDRRPYNEAEVLGMFRGAGFEPVYFEHMSLQEQVDAMSSAQIIAGPTGAAWTNLLFCAPGTKGLCWMAEPYREFSAYSTIAHVVGVDLRYLTFPTNARSTADLYSVRYRLEMAEVKRELDALLIETSD